MTMSHTLIDKRIRAFREAVTQSRGCMGLVLIRLGPELARKSKVSARRSA